MANVTFGRRLNVAYVFARRYRAVVAAAADSNDLRMIDARNGSERDDCVAVLADVRRLNMRRRLANGVDVIVAAHAVARDVVVIEVGGNPRGRRMAVLASVPTRDVRRRLARNDGVVVAAHASPNDLEMIDLRDGRECDDRVAILADVRREDVARRLTDRVDTIVAARAISHDVVVVEVGRHEACGRVTELAAIPTRNVAQILPRRGCTVVTAHACA